MAHVGSPETRGNGELTLPIDTCSIATSLSNIEAIAWANERVLWSLKMPILTNEFLAQLTSYLESLPEVAQGNRDLSWRDTEQILDHWKAQCWEPPTADPDALDQALIAAVNQPGLALQIRSAKYPGRSSLRRFWGHVANVGERPPFDATLTEGRQLVFEELNLPPDAPQVFLSHSHADVHFVSRVRLEMGRSGLRPWISEEGLEKGNLIIEGIRRAVQRSTAVLALVTRRSLGQAWLESEIYYSPTQVILVFDSTDDDLLALLSHWCPNPHSISPQGFVEISNMKNSLRNELTSTRFEKYEENAKNFLKTLSSLSPVPCKTIYPRRPPGWHGSNEFHDFSTVFGERLGVWLEQA
jgi:hypothetical protein